jgi:hypothetical protein
MSLAIRETFVNATDNHMIGEEVCTDLFTQDRGELFRSLRKEYGRCISSVYVDTKDGPPQRVGWVFQKRDHYTDTHEPYLREVWVHVFETDEDQSMLG